MTNPEREYKRKQQTEITRKQYREAARELFPYVSISDYAHVSRTLDGDGAYVECTVWVPRPPEEIVTPE